MFQCSIGKLCKKLIRHHWNCIIYRQNGNMLSDVMKQRSRLLEKSEKSLRFLARPEWVAVQWRHVLRALQNPPSLSATEWMQCSLPGITGRIVLSSPKQGAMTILCDYRTVVGRPFSLGHITDFRPFKAKHHSASSTST